MLENSHAWMGASSSSIADSYQYQLQSMWQKCWNTNQNLMHHLRFRERGPLKSWRPETMAEAIFSVLKEGLSLSQAARKYDIPYPTFVLYANRVHNMLGPSIDGGPDLRPKGRGRPQRILLGIWPDDHIKGVIKTVVFRDAKDIKEDTSSLVAHLPYGRHSPVYPIQDASLNYPGVGGPFPNGIPGAAGGEQMSQEATAAAVAAVAHNIRQQMQMAAAVQHQHVSEGPGGPNIFNLPPHLQASAGMAQMPGSTPGVISLPKASISPALTSGSNTTGGSSILGSRHASSPCAPPPGMSGLSNLPNLPPSMAVALHMVGGPGGRCNPTAALLSQQQQHQLQQLHLQQQQHVLQQEQQRQQQQQQQHVNIHPIGFGASGAHSTPSSSTLTSISSSTGTSGTATMTTSGSTQPTIGNVGATKSKTHGQQHISPSNDTPIHSPLTELSLELSDYKPVRGVGGFSPSRLFSDDIADLVGSVTASSSTTATATSSAITTKATASIVAPTSNNQVQSNKEGSNTTSNDGGTSSIKIEPIASNE